MEIKILHAENNFEFVMNCMCHRGLMLPLSFPGFVAEQFLNSTATQLTYHGLCELTSTVQEGELCVFFRNNHFSTMTKFKVFIFVTSAVL